MHTDESSTVLGEVADFLQLYLEEQKRLKKERIEPTMMRQVKVRNRLETLGILVPPEYIDTSISTNRVEAEYWAPVPVLTEAGENWARREIQKRRDERIEFWMRTLLPVLSLIVSIVAIVISVRR